MKECPIYNHISLCKFRQLWDNKSKTEAFREYFPGLDQSSVHLFYKTNLGIELRNPSMGLPLVLSDNSSIKLLQRLFHYEKFVFLLDLAVEYGSESVKVFNKWNFTIQDLAAHWQSILGSDVISGKQSLTKRSLELYPDRDNTSLLTILKMYSPDFVAWYDSTRSVPVMKRYNLDPSIFQDWKSLLGPEVLSGKKSIRQRNLELWPNDSGGSLLILLNRYAPDSFREWYQSYETPMRNFQSTLEKSLIKEFNDLGINTTQYNKLRNTSMNRGQIDVYLPELKVGFELNGYYYHCLGHKDSSSKDNRYYHRDKTTAALQQGIKLYHLWYESSIDLDRVDLIRSVIFAKIGLFGKKYYARKLEFRIVPPKVAVKFYKHNHLQGSPLILNYCYGLYDRDLLVSCLSFNYRNKQLELARFASLRHTCVVGGFSKLFKHALLLLPAFHSIVSYGDRDLIPDPKDSVYIRNGFKLVNNLKTMDLQLEYFIPSKVSNYYRGIYSRQTFQKHKLLKLFPEEDPSQREIDIAIKHGIFPCYNSGCWKFIYYR